jgi:hypothetical protein
MKHIAILFLTCILASCSKNSVTVHDRGEQFAHDTSFSFSQFAGEPAPVSRTIKFDITGRIEVVDGFWGRMKETKPSILAISPDSVRLLVRYAIDAGFFTLGDSVFEEPEEGTLDGPANYHFELNAGRRSKTVKTDGSDRSRSMQLILGLSNVAEYFAWVRLPEEKRWRWYGPAWTMKDVDRYDSVYFR